MANKIPGRIDCFVLHWRGGDPGPSREIAEILTTLSAQKKTKYDYRIATDDSGNDNYIQIDAIDLEKEKKTKEEWRRDVKKYNKKRNEEKFKEIKKMLDNETEEEKEERRRYGKSLIYG